MYSNTCSTILIHMGTQGRYPQTCTHSIHTHLSLHTDQINSGIKNTLKQLKEGKVYSSSWFEHTVRAFHRGANVTRQELEQLTTLPPQSRTMETDGLWCSAGFLLCIRSETPAGKGMLPAHAHIGWGFTPRLAQSFY